MSDNRQETILLSPGVSEEDRKSGAKKEVYDREMEPSQR